ncbi:MAG: inhibitor of vertebrate lysozyme family protein [Prevotellaceae bacterium]|jgi:hypothetical protein|nr:inhibitor of vertebrate lysozyme family protein [Prevotellaceae bacterium]
MKRFLCSSILGSLTVCCVAFLSCGSPARGDLSFLKSYHQQYPSDVQLWENRAFAERLRQVVGNDTVMASLPSLRGTEMPVTVAGDEVVVSACRQHDCHHSNIIIVVDLAANSVAVGIRKDGAVTVYRETAVAPAALQAWQDEALMMHDE